MTIFELGALGEFVGSIAVVVTLIYLAMQIRQNTRSMDENKQYIISQTYQARSDQIISANIETALSAEFCELHANLLKSGWPKVTEAFSQMSAGEQLQISSCYRAHLARWDNQLFQLNRGHFDKEDYEDMSQPLSYFVPRWRALDSHLRPSFEQEFDRFEVKQDYRSLENNPDSQVLENSGHPASRYCANYTSKSLLQDCHGDYHAKGKRQNA